MYFYSFSKFFGIDRVFSTHMPEGKPFYKKGDLLKDGEDFLICLGDDIVFQEIYTHTYSLAPGCEIIIKEFLQEKTVELISYIVYTYYSTYKSTIKYFVPSDDFGQILEYEIKKKLRNIGTQELIIFPDLRTIYNSPLSEDIGSDTVILNSKQTDLQKTKARRDIKKGKISRVICTHAEIFQDWKDLQKITIIDPHKRYYKNHQDPRYKVSTVIEKMKELYGAQIEMK